MNPPRTTTKNCGPRTMIVVSRSSLLGLLVTTSFLWERTTFGFGAAAPDDYGNTNYYDTSTSPDDASGSPNPKHPEGSSSSPPPPVQLTALDPRIEAPLLYQVLLPHGKARAPENRQSSRSAQYGPIQALQNFELLVEICARRIARAFEVTIDSPNACTLQQLRDALGNFRFPLIKPTITIQVRKLDPFDHYSSAEAWVRTFAAKTFRESVSLTLR